MRRAFAIVAGVSFALAAACGSFGASDDDGSPPPDGGDASTKDGGAPSDGSVEDTSHSALTDATDEDGAIAGAIFEDGFENGTGCAWSFTQVTGERVTDAGAASGNAACRVCSTSTSGGTAMFKPFPATALGTYRLEARAKKQTAPIWELRVDLYAPDGGFMRGQYNSGTLSDSWSLAQTSISTTTPIGHVEMRVIVDATPGTCYLVDDIVLYHDP